MSEGREVGLTILGLSGLAAWTLFCARLSQEKRVVSTVVGIVINLLPVELLAIYLVWKG